MSNEHDNPSEAESAFYKQFMGVGAGATLSPGAGKRKPRNQQFADEDAPAEQSAEEEPAPVDWAKGRVEDDLQIGGIRFTKDDGTGEPGPQVVNAAGQPAGHALPLDDDLFEQELARAKREGWLPDDDDDQE
jgi:hypothetical protein